MVKNPPSNAGVAGDVDLIPESGRSPGVGSGNPLQYSCLENPHGQRSLAGYSSWGHKESDMTEATEHTRTQDKGYVTACIHYLLCVYYCVLVAQSCPTLCNPEGCCLPGSSVHGDSPGKNTGVDCHLLLQGILPARGLNPHSPPAPALQADSLPTEPPG